MSAQPPSNTGFNPTRVPAAQEPAEPPQIDRGWVDRWAWVILEAMRELADGSVGHDVANQHVNSRVAERLKLTPQARAVESITYTSQTEYTTRIGAIREALCDLRVIEKGARSNPRPHRLTSKGLTISPTQLQTELDGALAAFRGFVFNPEFNALVGQQPSDSETPDRPAPNTATPAVDWSAEKVKEAIVGVLRDAPGNFVSGATLGTRVRQKLQVRAAELTGEQNKSFTAMYRAARDQLSNGQRIEQDGGYDRWRLRDGAGSTGAVETEAASKSSPTANAPTAENAINATVPISDLSTDVEYAKERHTLLGIEDVSDTALGGAGIHLVGWRDPAGRPSNTADCFAYRIVRDHESLGPRVGQEIRNTLPQVESWLSAKLAAEYPSVAVSVTGHVLMALELDEALRREQTSNWNRPGVQPIGLHIVPRGVGPIRPTGAPPRSRPAASTPAGVNTTQTAASTGGDTIDKQAGLQRYPADPAERWHEALLQIISDELPSAETHGMGFELLCAELLESHDDVKSLERVGGVGDGGLDVFAELKHGGRRYVQCKHHASRPVNDREVSSFLGKVDNRVGHGAHVEASYYTTSRYTAHAISEADQKRRKFPVELVDGDGLCTQLFSSRLGCKEHFADGQRWVVLDRNYFRELRGKLVSR